MIILGLRFVETCGACPEQYDVFLDDRQVGYVRLRHGYLSIRYPDVSGDEVYQAYPRNSDGCFTDDGVRRRHLKRGAKAILEKLIQSPTQPDGNIGA